MSIKDELKLSGYFKIDDIENIPGTLFISRDGDIELELFTTFEIGKSFLDVENIPIITGQVEKKGYITLEDSFFTNKSFGVGTGLINFKIVSNYVYMGASFHKIEDIKFDTFKFELDGFGQWLGKYTIDTNTLYENNEFTVKSSLQKNKYEYDLEEGNKLFFEFNHSSQMANSLTSEVTVTQKISLKLTNENNIHLKDFIFMSYKLINFFSFVTNAGLGIKNIFVSNKDITQKIGEKDYPIDIEVIYKSTNKVNEKTSYHPHDMLFSFNDIEQTFESKIQNWLKNYQTIKPTMNLYFSVRQNTHLYEESKFLFLIQALETYHRRTSNEQYMDDEIFQSLSQHIIESTPDEHKQWLEGKLKFGNEISLRTRIKKIIEPFNDLIGTSKERKSLIGKILDTRNYLTHYNIDLKANALSGFNLIELNKKLEGLLELSFLKELKFSKEEIDNIFKKIIMKKFKNK